MWEVIFGGIGVVVVSGGVTGLVSWGIMKGKQEIYVTHPSHREMCHDKSTETYAKIDTNHQAVMNILLEIKQDIGRLEGKNVH